MKLLFAAAAIASFPFSYFLCQPPVSVRSFRPPAPVTIPVSDLTVSCAGTSLISLSLVPRDQIVATVPAQSRDQSLCLEFSSPVDLDKSVIALKISASAPARCLLLLSDEHRWTMHLSEAVETAIGTEEQTVYISKKAVKALIDTSKISSIRLVIRPAENISDLNVYIKGMSLLAEQ
jgi:hypothetical protein